MGAPFIQHTDLEKSYNLNKLFYYTPERPCAFQILLYVGHTLLIKLPTTHSLCGHKFLCCFFAENLTHSLTHISEM